MHTWGTIPPEPARIATLDGIAPAVAAAARRTLVDMAANGKPAVLAETLRTAARQAWLYGFGRLYDDGRGIVTNVDDPFTGWHPLGLAVDFWSATDEWHPGSDFWQLLYTVGARYGLRAGIHIRPGGGDAPHMQWQGCRVSPTWRSRALYKVGGLPAVWRAVGAA